MQVDFYAFEKLALAPAYYVAPTLEIFMKDEVDFIPDNPLKTGVVTFENGSCGWFMPDDEFRQAGRNIFEKILTDEKWAAESNKRVREKSLALRVLSDRIKSTNFAGCSNLQLADAFGEFSEVLLETQASGMLSFIMEYHELLTKHLTDYLNKRIQEKQLDLNASEVLSVLTTPLEETSVKQSETALLELAAKAVENPAFAQAAKNAGSSDSEGAEALVDAFPEIAERLDELHSKFCWISYVYYGPAKPRGDFARELVQLAAGGNPKELLKETMRKPFELKRKQERVLEQLEVNAQHAFLLNYAREVVFLKGLRKDAIYRAFYNAEEMLKEIAKRLNTSLDVLHALHPQEIIGLLRGGKRADAVYWNRRLEYTVFHLTRGFRNVLYGEEAKSFMNGLKLSKENAGGEREGGEGEKIVEFKGTCACLGEANAGGRIVGRVKIVYTQFDNNKVEKGDILVSPATNPDLVPAMKRASAIITDQGGLTCHAAIVSRELGVPCIVGAKNASQLLHDGDLVEVDASKGIVKKVEAG